MKIDDKIELNWTLKVNYTFKKYDIFQSLEELFNIYEKAPDNVDYSNYVIEWLKDNLINYIKDFLTISDIDCNTDGEIRYESITELLDNEEFMKEFKQYLSV